MTRVFIRQLLFAAISAIAVLLLSSCGTTPSRHITRQLPPFEPPIAKADFQTVRTTAYTHTESDHLEYGRHNALGGELRAATVPSRRRAEYIDRTLPKVAAADVDYQFGATSKKTSTSDDEDKPGAKSAKSKSAKGAKHSSDDTPKAKTAKASKTAKPRKEEGDGDIPKAKAVQEGNAKAAKAHDDSEDAPKAKAAKVAKRAKAGADDEKSSKSKEKSRVVKNEKEKARDEKKLKNAKRAVAVKKPAKPVIGSAAADWARWPYGTTFRIVSTGQIYRVDDIGWALAGRNTIDLYMPNTRDMNAWGTRNEKIEIIKWGDEEESARLLAARSDYKHVRRMLLELSGRYDEAAQLQ